MNDKPSQSQSSQSQSSRSQSGQSHKLLDDLEMIEQLLKDKVSSFNDAPKSNSPVLENIAEDIVEDVATGVVRNVASDAPGSFQAVIHPSVSIPLVIMPSVKSAYVAPAAASNPVKTTDPSTDSAIIAPPQIASSQITPPQFVLADSLEDELRLEGEKMIQGVIDDWLPRLESRLRQHLNEVLDQYVGERVASWQDS